MRLFYLLLFTFCLLQCKPADKVLEINIEDKKDFARKLADLYFIDSWVTRASKVEKDSIKNMLSSDFKELYGISVDEFHKKLDELKTDPIMFSEIMDSVGVILKNKGRVKK